MHFSKRRRLTAFRLLLVALLTGCATSPVMLQPVQVVGTVWQPDNATLAARGQWDRLGATQLLVQWTAVGRQGFVAGCEAVLAAAPLPVPVPPNAASAPLPPPPPPAPPLESAPAAGQTLPDWDRIAAEPWAQSVVLGLAGEFDEATARREVVSLAERSRCLAALPTPLRVAGYYFPVEVDPTWDGARALAPLLRELPRPLWISVYDSANRGPAAMADSLATWLPGDVGVYFQDGVGVYARTPAVALDYVRALQQRLGAGRVRLIAEAFRPRAGGGFRPATADELVPHLQAYAGQQVWLFDGPHYVDRALVERLRAAMLFKK